MNKPPVLLIVDEISKAAFSLLLKEPFYAGGVGWSAHGSDMANSGW